jgi:hypothetical protein
LIGTASAEVHGRDGAPGSLVVSSTARGLIAAQLMGLAFMRFVWKIEPLASLDDDAIVAAIAPTIQRYLDSDVYAATREAPPAE